MKLILLAIAGSVFLMIVATSHVRRLPPIDRGPEISARPDLAPEQFGVVQPSFEFRLFEDSRPNSRHDEDALPGVRPAWEILVLAICVFLYVYSRYASVPVTGNRVNKCEFEQDLLTRSALAPIVLWIVHA